MELVLFGLNRFPNVSITFYFRIFETTILVLNYMLYGLGKSGPDKFKLCDAEVIHLYSHLIIRLWLANVFINVAFLVAPFVTLINGQKIAQMHPQQEIEVAGATRMESRMPIFVNRFFLHKCNPHLHKGTYTKLRDSGNNVRPR